MTSAKRTAPQAVEPLHWAGEDWPRYLDAPLARGGNRAALLAALAMGVAFDLAVRSGVDGVAGASSIALAVVLLVTSGRLANGQGYALVLGAVAFAPWLAIRTSGWLLLPDIVAAGGLIALGASLSSGGSIANLSLTGLIARGAQALVQVVLAPDFLLRHAEARGSGSKSGAAVRGVVLAVPIVAVLVALLASADAVFASFVRVDLSDVIAHTVLVALGTLAMGTLLRLASLARTDEPRLPKPRLGPVEWTVVLVALNVVLAAFAVARIVSLTEGGQRVIRSAGLTYAEYARSGFFQLLGAALLTTAALVALRALADATNARTRLRFIALALGVVALTLAMVVSAFHRLVLYESVFGLTVLRIYAQTAIVWIGIVLLMVGARVAGVGGRRAWLAAGAGISALALLFALNVMNPEAFVARHNIAHQDRAARFDAPYLSALSDDAVPALAKHPAVRAEICAVRPNPSKSWTGYNLARDRAREIRARLCRTGG